MLQARRRGQLLVAGARQGEWMGVSVAWWGLQLYHAAPWYP